MEIDKKIFKKLKQLDRIEYRQRQDRINSGFKGLGWGKLFLKTIAVFLIFLALIVPQGYLVWGYAFVKDISSLVGSIVLILFTFSIFGFIGDYLFKKVRDKELKELDEEYFSIEAKKN